MLLCVVVPLVAIDFAVVWYAVRTSRAVAEDLGASNVRQATAIVEVSAEHHFAEARRVSDRFALRLKDGRFRAVDRAWWRNVLFADLRSSNVVSSICFAKPNGDTVWLMQTKAGLEWGEVDGSIAEGNNAVGYFVGEDGSLAAEPFRRYRYNASERPWYKIAAASDHPTWTPVYFWFTLGDRNDDVEASTGYTRRVFDVDANELGTLVVDMSLDQLSALMREQALRLNGWLYLIDENDELVAASEGPVADAVGKRRPLATSSSIAARSAATAMRRLAGQSTEQQLESGSVSIQVDGEPCRLHVKEFVPTEAGKRWRMVVVTPESIFMERSDQLLWRLTVVSALLGVASLIIVVLVTRWMSRTVRTVGTFVTEVGHGRFDDRLDVGGSRELVALSDSLNRMAADLKREVQLRAEKEAAESASAAKSAFLMAMSHELRTPLNTVIGYSEMLRDEARRADRMQDVDDLNRVLLSSRHLLTLINDLLDLAKIESGKLQIDVTVVDLRRAIDEVREAIVPTAIRNGNAIVAEFAEGAPVTVATDATRLRQILLNLVGNAAKFTRDGVVQVRLDVEALSGEQHVRIDVIDNGPGIEPDVARRLFEPFYQGEMGIARKHGGTGLGLALSRQLARTLGGDVTFASPPEGGSIFSLTLPVCRAHNAN